MSSTDDKFREMYAEVIKNQCVMIAHDLKNKEWIVQSYENEDVPDEVLEYLLNNGCTFIDYSESVEFHRKNGVIVQIPCQPDGWVKS